MKVLFYVNAKQSDSKTSILFQPNNAIQHKLLLRTIRIQAKIPRPHSLKPHRLRRAPRSSVTPPSFSLQGEFFLIS